MTSGTFLLAPMALLGSMLGTTIHTPAPVRNGLVGQEEARLQDAPEVVTEPLVGEPQRHALATFEMTDMVQAGAVFVRIEGARDLATPDPAAVVKFLDGSHLGAGVRGGAGERLDLELPGGSRLQLGVENLRALEFPSRFPAEGAAPEAAKEGDRLYLARARGVDRVDGFVVGFAKDGILFESRVGERTHPWDEIVALYIEPLDTPAPAERARPISITLRGGGVLAGDLERLDAQGLQFRFAGSSRTLNPAEIEEIAVDDGRFAFLSTLVPSDLGPLNPFDPPGTEPLGLAWPPRMDAAVDGGPLRVGGRTWNRGIGVHSPSRVTWTLEKGHWSQLRVACGVDDRVAGEARRGGTVRFRIHVGGELKWESPIVRPGEPVLFPEAIELGDATQLILEVDPVDDWVLDRAAWLRPILVKA
tara:strand:- start:16612 stop:17865 length:1254 start_codon:yes stop_codon:yes gene_type:complete